MFLDFFDLTVLGILLVILVIRWVFPYVFHPKVSIKGDGIAFVTKFKKSLYLWDKIRKVEYRKYGYKSSRGLYIIVHYIDDDKSDKPKKNYIMVEYLNNKELIKETIREFCGKNNIECVIK